MALSYELQLQDMAVVRAYYPDSALMPARRRVVRDGAMTLEQGLTLNKASHTELAPLIRAFERDSTP